jgi:aminopeptidase
MPHPVHDILHKNIWPITGEIVVMYDLESPLSCELTEAYRSALPDATYFQFGSPGAVEAHAENAEKLKAILIALPTDSLVVMIQSANFRLSDFRVRLELSQYGIHCIEHNHLGYLAPEESSTYIKALEYRTSKYVKKTAELERLRLTHTSGAIVSPSGERLEFGELEAFRGNTGDYSESRVRGGTFPIGEAFSEAVDLSSVSGKVKIFGYPNMQFKVIFCEPFTADIVAGKFIHDDTHPADFLSLMSMIREAEEGEVLVREIGVGFNPAISRETPLSDVNAYERQLGMHLSLGKKHGIFAKKFPKTEVQKYHIDVFLEVGRLEFGGEVFGGL